MKVDEHHIAQLDALAVMLGTNGNRSATLRRLLDAPLFALVLVSNQLDMSGAKKETADLLQTGRAAARATGDGVNRLSSDTRGGNSHVITSDFTPNG